MEIRRNKKWEKFLKREHIQKQVEIINLKAPSSNLQTTAVKITSNVDQPPGEKRIEPKKRDSNKKSYAKVLMNTLTAKEQITDTDSQFSPLALDDSTVTDHRSQKGKNLVKAASP